MNIKVILNVKFKFTVFTVILLIQMFKPDISWEDILCYLVCKNYVESF